MPFGRGHQTAAREALPRLTLRAARQGFPPLYLRPAKGSLRPAAIDFMILRNFGRSAIVFIILSLLLRARAADTMAGILGRPHVMLTRVEPRGPRVGSSWSNATNFSDSTSSRCISCRIVYRGRKMLVFFTCLLTMRLVINAELLRDIEYCTGEKKPAK